MSGLGLLLRSDKLDIGLQDGTEAKLKSELKIVSHCTCGKKDT